MAVDRKDVSHQVCATCAPRFLYPVTVRGVDTTPGYEVSPITDSAVVRLVERHGVLYPIFRGFYATLLRLVYGVEGCAEPFRDDLLGRYPLRELDRGTSAYDWESIVPWPYKWRSIPPRWHPWLRGPGHKEAVIKKAKDGEVTEKPEEVWVKGRLRFFVMERASVQVPVVSLGSYRAIIAYEHGHGSVDGMAAMKDLAITRAISAEQQISVEASRQALQSYEEHFAKEAEEGTARPTVAGQLLADADNLKRMASEEDEYGA